MSLRNFISGTVFLKLSDLLTGSSIYEKLNFLMESQYWTAEQFQNYQNHRLQLLINHSYTNVPFYRELFDNLGLKPKDIQTKGDLEKLRLSPKRC